MRKSLLLAALALVGLAPLASAKSVIPQAASSLTDGGTYYIYDAHNTGDKRHAMLHVVESEGNYKATYNTAITPESAVTEAPAIDYVWVAVADGENWKFKNLSTGRYIMGTDKAVMSDSEAAAQSLTLKSYNGASTTFNVQKPNGDGWDKNPGNTELVYWAGGHPIEFYSAVADGEGYVIATKTAIDLTVNYMCGEDLVQTVELSVGEGDEYAITTAPAFYELDEAITGTAGTEDEEIDVNVHVALPFVVSESLDDLKWQTVQQHSSYRANNGKKGNAWKYEAENENLRAFMTDFVASPEAVADEYLWAFVGSLKDGFKIYNKKAGTGKTLWRQDANSISRVGTPAEDASDVWYVKPSGTNADSHTFCCFDQNDNQYINLQNWENGNAIGTLNKWGGADQGSTVWFSTMIADPFIEYYASVLNTPAGAVGAPSAEALDTFKAAYDAAKDDRFNGENAATLAAAYETLNASEKVPFDPDKYYRALNLMYGTYLYGNDADEVYGNNRTPLTEIGSIVRFEVAPAVAEEGEETEEPTEPAAPVYNIFIQGVNISGVDGTSKPFELTEDEDMVGRFEIVPGETPSTFTFVCVNEGVTKGYSSIHCAASQSYKTVSWEPAAAASQWYLIPAEEIEVNVDGVAAGYYPVPLKATEGVAINYLVEKESLVGEPNYMTLVEAGVAPAETGIIITAAEPGAVKLAIAYGDAADTEIENVLSGSLRPFNAKGTDYKLSDIDGQLAVVKITPTVVETPEEGEPVAQAAALSKLVDCNEVYIPADNTTGAESYLVKAAEVGVTGITISEATLSLEEGATATLTAALEPADAINGEAIVWTSSNEAVATVANGVVTAVAEGTATITAAANGFTATCTVTVTKKTEDSLQTIVAEGAAKAYDLQGRKVAAPARGLYIINGQKTLVK